MQLPLLHHRGGASSNRTAQEVEATFASKLYHTSSGLLYAAWRDVGLRPHLWTLEGPYPVMDFLITGTTPLRE